jgi:hypothetical protein
MVGNVNPGKLPAISGLHVAAARHRSSSGVRRREKVLPPSRSSTPPASRRLPYSSPAAVQRAALSAAGAEQNMHTMYNLKMDYRTRRVHLTDANEGRTRRLNNGLVLLSGAKAE